MEVRFNTTGTADNALLVVADYAEERVAIAEQNARKRRLAQAGCPLGDRIEHRLNVTGGACHQLQDLVRRRMLLQRLRETHLEVSDRRGAGRARFPGDGALARGVCPGSFRAPIHRPPPGPDQLYKRTAIHNRLGEVAVPGKGHAEINRS